MVCAASSLTIPSLYWCKAIIKFIPPWARNSCFSEASFPTSIRITTIPSAWRVSSSSFPRMYSITCAKHPSLTILSLVSAWKVKGNNQLRNNIATLSKNNTYCRMLDYEQSLFFTQSPPTLLSRHTRPTKKKRASCSLKEIEHKWVLVTQKGRNKDSNMPHSLCRKKYN